MFAKFQEIDWHPDKQALLQFGRVLFLGCPFAAVAWFCIVRWFSGEWIMSVPIWITSIGWTISLLAYISRALALPFYWVWFFLIATIDSIITNTLLTVLYYVVITSAAFIMKVLGRDPLTRRIEVERKSYFEDAPKPKGLESYYNQF